MKNKEISTLKHAIKISYANKFQFFLSLVFDIMFFFVYGFVTAPIFNKLITHVNVIGGLASKAIESAMRENKSIFTILTEPSIAPYTYNILWLLGILGVTTYLTYCLFQAMNWKIALNLTGKKITYLEYFKKFLRINIPWFLLFVVYYSLGFVIDIRKIFIAAVTQTEPSSALNVILMFYFVIIAYFAVISYVKLDFKKCLYIGKSRIMQLLPSVLLVFVYLLLLQIIFRLLSSINPLLSAIIVLILLLPAFTIARIYISLLIQKM